VPGDPGSSEVFKRITTADAETRMPADGEPLSAAEQAVVREWIATGAAWPDDLASLAALLPAATPKRLAGEGHWAFQPLLPAAVPLAAATAAVPPAAAASAGANNAVLPAAAGAGADSAASANAIDGFVVARLAAANLAMNPPADPRTLLRRVSFDLVGLPPTPEEIAAFEADCAADGLDRASTRVVDRLLASPHHGERWARHWLDVVRFAESHGISNALEIGIACATFGLVLASLRGGPIARILIRGNGLQPVRIDLLNRIAGVTFAEARASTVRGR
jgi:hypothetical protein